MFQWQITLSDRQVIMLTAFQMAKPDKDGSIFHSAHSMIADAWDTRAVRKLEEQNLIHIDRDGQSRATRWKISEKGRLIAQAIICDADNLRELRGRKGSMMLSEINQVGREHRLRRQKKKVKKV